MSVFPATKTALRLTGPVGQLEARVCATAVPQVRGVGVVCHPHPLYGGTMHNKVVTTVFKALLSQGFHAIRFNYRGVGESDGEFADAIGETEDCLAVIHWVQQQTPELPLVLAGFSFGAYVAASAASQLATPPQQLITIAPAVEHAPFDQLPPLVCPWAMLIPEADEVVSAQASHAWLTTRREAIEVVSFPGASHFFHGQLITLRESICQVLSS